MAYQVVQRVSAVKVGAYGALEGACTSVGGVESLTYRYTETPEHGTSAAAGGARVIGAGFEPAFEFEFTGDEITLTNLAFIMRGTVDTNDMEIVGTGGAFTKKAVFVNGMAADDRQKTLHIPAAVLLPDAEVVYEAAQHKYTLKGVGYYDATATYTAKLTDAVADTTPPTISSTSPADGATGVAKAASTTVIWTFDEAIQSADVIAAKFFVHKDDGSIVAGALTINSTNTIVTFTPSGAWDATTKHHTVVVGGTGGVKDTAGNALAATAVTDFTTAA